MARLLIPTLLLVLLPLACQVERPAGLAEILDGLRDTGGGQVEDAAFLPDEGQARPDLQRPDLPATCEEGAPCEDGDPCTTGDLCVGGQCIGGLTLRCDDGDPCTLDACDSALACVYVLLDTPECGPPRPCEGDCDDGEPCTLDRCDERVGECVHEAVPDCLACDPTQAPSLTCDDGDPGTEDRCEHSPALGGHICLHVPLPCGLDPASCDDGDECTEDRLGADCLCYHEPVC